MVFNRTISIAYSETVSKNSFSCKGIIIIGEDNVCNVDFLFFIVVNSLLK